MTLPAVIAEYNGRVHSTTQMSPDDAWRAQCSSRGNPDAQKHAEAIRLQIVENTRRAGAKMMQRMAKRQSSTVSQVELGAAMLLMSTAKPQKKHSVRTRYAPIINSLPRSRAFI